jgi:hypothetical protein
MLGGMLRCMVLDKEPSNFQHIFCYMDIFAKQQWHCPPGSSRVNLISCDSLYMHVPVSVCSNPCSCPQIKLLLPCGGQEMLTNAELNPAPPGMLVGAPPPSSTSRYGGW